MYRKRDHNQSPTNTPRVFNVERTWNTRGVFVGKAPGSKISSRLLNSFYSSDNENKL